MRCVVRGYPERFDGLCTHRWIAWSIGDEDPIVGDVLRIGLERIVKWNNSHTHPLPASRYRIAEEGEKKKLT
jgi:hypothetical protein